MSNIYPAKGETIEDQYRDLGALFGESIRASVNKLIRKRSRLANVRKMVAEKSLQHMQTLPLSEDFLRCMSAWCEGAQISQNQAMWLLADNLSGCQTMMVRYGSGVALLHTEEEFRENAQMELHMTEPQTVSVRDGNAELKTLVYNNLLPGCGLYSWKKDLVIAMDSLFLREDGIEEVERPLLANVISWMVWRMEVNEIYPENIVAMVNKMGELVDGYAINIVRKIKGEVEGFKLTLARSESRIEYLPVDTGSYLRQVNIIDPSYPKMEWALPPKNIWRGGWKYFTLRLNLLDKHAQKYHKLAFNTLNEDKIATAHSQIQQTLYGPLRSSYVNLDMGAICVGLIDRELGVSVSCKLNDEQDLTALEYLDVIG
jgi:hypothetical protein